MRELFSEAAINFLLKLPADLELKDRADRGRWLMSRKWKQKITAL